MLNKTKAVAAFLEAHYYSGGLRYHHASIDGRRPDWAPPSEDVGFRDELPLSNNDLVVEFQRRRFQGRGLTWLAIYGPSIDEKLGNRSNHSGIGIWLCDLNIVDARNLIYAMKQLMSVVSGGQFNPSIFENHATKFLSDWLPSYVHDIDAFQLGFAGVPYAESALSATGAFGISSDGSTDKLELVADKLMMLSFRTQPRAPSRALIYVPDNNEWSLPNIQIETIKAGTDYLSELITAIPDALEGASQELVLLRSQLADAEQEVKSLSERNSKLSSSSSIAERSRLDALARLSTFEQLAASKKPDLNLRDVMFRLDEIYKGQTRLETLLSMTGSRTRGGAGKSGGRDPQQEIRKPVASGKMSTDTDTWHDVLFWGSLAVFAVVVFGLIMWGAIEGVEWYRSR